MRKNYLGRQFKRDKNERAALFKGLLTSLVLNERIETTEAKAKAIRPMAEKLVTKAKKHAGNEEYFLQPFLAGEALKKMIGDIAPRFSSRNGGYIRIIKSGNRLKDNAKTAILEWVEKPVVKEKTEEVKTTKAKQSKQTKPTKRLSAQKLKATSKSSLAKSSRSKEK